MLAENRFGTTLEVVAMFTNGPKAVAQVAYAAFQEMLSQDLRSWSNHTKWWPINIKKKNRKTYIFNHQKKKNSKD